MLSGFADAYERHWAEGMAAKLGLAAPDRELVEDILKLMRLQKVDFTQFFRALSAGTAWTLFTEPEPFDAWSARREVLLPADRVTVAAAMGPGQPRLYPAQSPRRGGACEGDRWRDGAVPPSCGRRLLPLLTSGPAWRTAPVRHPWAPPRTSPTAAPEHGLDDIEGRSTRLLGAFCPVGRNAPSVAVRGGRAWRDAGPPQVVPPGAVSPDTRSKIFLPGRSSSSHCSGSWPDRRAPIRPPRSRTASPAWFAPVTPAIRTHTSHRADPGALPGATFPLT